MWPRDRHLLWVAGMGLVFVTGCSTGWGTKVRPLNDRERLQMENNFESQMTMKPVLPDSPDLFYFDERDVAADSLARIGSESVPELCVALKSTNPRVRRFAALALAREGSNAAPAVPDLVELLRDDDAEVRRAAARALGQIGPAAKSAVPALIRVLGDGAPSPTPAPAPALAAPTNEGAAMHLAMRAFRCS